MNLQYARGQELHPQTHPSREHFRVRSTTSPLSPAVLPPDMRNASLSSHIASMKSPYFKAASTPEIAAHPRRTRCPWLSSTARSYKSTRRRRTPLAITHHYAIDKQHDSGRIKGHSRRDRRERLASLASVHVYICMQAT